MKKTSPHHYDDPAYVKKWAEEVNRKRPFRRKVFRWMVTYLKLVGRPLKILEIGSGPGYLAEYLLSNVSVDQYLLWDSSKPMQEIAGKRLMKFRNVTRRVTVSFEDQPKWRGFRSKFDAIVTIQAIHELRDARKIPRLYGNMFSALKPRGILLLADRSQIKSKPLKHLLHPAEHMTALRDGGFENIQKGPVFGDLVLLKARKLLRA